MKDLAVIVCGLIQVDVVADPSDRNQVFEATLEKLDSINESAGSLDGSPQIFTEGLHPSDLSWETEEE